MGASLSRAEAGPAAGGAGALPAAAPPKPAAAEEPKPAAAEHAATPDGLPLPIKYEEIQREAMSASRAGERGKRSLSGRRRRSRAGRCRVAAAPSRRGRVPPRVVPRGDAERERGPALAAAASLPIPPAGPALFTRPAPSVSLKPELFEGMRFDFNKARPPVAALSTEPPPPCPHFSPSPLSRAHTGREPEVQPYPLRFHGFRRGARQSSRARASELPPSHSPPRLAPFPQVPAQGTQIIKIPASSYEFGAIVVDGPLLLVGKVFTDGRRVQFLHSLVCFSLVSHMGPSPLQRLSGRVKYDVSADTSVKVQTQLVQEAGYSQAMVDVDTKGGDWQAQLKLVSAESTGFVPRAVNFRKFPN